MAKIKNSWQYGRGAGTLKNEMHSSIKANKKKLNRRVRHQSLKNGCFYKKYAGECAYDLTT